MKRIKISDPNVKLVTVLTLTDPVNAEIIKNVLVEHDIQVEIGNEHQAGFSGTLPIEIIVREQDAETATELIDEFFKSELP